MQLVHSVSGESDRFMTDVRVEYANSTQMVPDYRRNY